MRYALLPLMLLLSLCADTNAQGWKWGIGNNVGFLGVIEATPTAVDPSGNVFLGGTYFNADTVHFGSCTIGKPYTNYAIFVVKADSSGNFLWARSIDANPIITMTSITTDTLGNVYVFAMYKATMCIVGPDTLLNPSNLYMDFVAKYDPSGSVVWAKNVTAIGTTSGGGSGGIRLDAAGNIYLAHEFNLSSIAIGSTTITNHSSGNADVYIAKFDTVLNPVWATGFGGDLYDFATGMSVSPAGNIAITGRYYSDSMVIGTDTLRNPSGGTSTLTYLVRVDSSGHSDWAFNAASNTTVYAVKIDDTEHLYTAGSVNGSVILGPDTIVAYSLDPLLVKYDSSGSVIWARQATGIPTSSTGGAAYAVDIDKSGNIWECGWAGGRMKFDTSIVDTPYIAYTPMFLAAYSPSGSYVNHTGSQIPSLNGDDPGSYGLAAAWQTGTVYVSGDYEDMSVIVGPDTLPNPPYLGEYAMLAKYRVSPPDTGGDISPLRNASFHAHKNSINIYPNPAAGEITINSMATFAPGTSASVFDLTGKLAKNAPLAGISTSVSVADLVPGVYYCKIMQGANVIEVKKIVVVR